MLNEERMIEIIREEELDYRTAEQLADRFCADDSEREELFALLGRCLERGRLTLTKKGKYVLPERVGLLRGRIQGSRKGFAFFIRDDGMRPDLFVAPGNLRGALHGDVVLVRMVPDGRDECEVVLIAERSQKPVVGRFTAERGHGYVVPFDAKANFDLFIPGSRAGGARDGDTVVARIDHYAEGLQNPEGHVEEILGRGDRDSQILAIIRSHDLREEFPDKVRLAAEAMPAELTEKDVNGREDFRPLTTVTIDGEDSRDLDDAISLEELPGGGYLLGVHIADVAHYVREGSAIDREAFERGTSVYFPDRVYPMLPRELSNGICSLNGGVDRLTLSCMIEFDAGGDVVSSRLAEGIINTAARMTYTDVSAILDGDASTRERYVNLVPLFERMERLTKLLIAKRERRGAVDLDVPEFKVILDDHNEIADIVPYPRKIANRIIEEFMIAANECVAESMFYCELPFLYRVHEPPLAEKVETFAAFVQGLGFRLKGNPERITPHAYSKLLNELEGQPVRSLVNRVMLRTMCKAKYSPQEIGHFGLSAKFYCHFTSPIRRYPDLFIHRVIKAMLHGDVDGEAVRLWRKNVEGIARHCSERERVADEAERDVDDYYKAEYMHKHLGDSYSGIVSSVKDFGLFVELPNTIEGLLRRESLPDDDYVFEERQFALIGRRHTYCIGDALEVTVAAADVFSGKIEFVLTDALKSLGRGKSSSAKPRKQRFGPIGKTPQKKDRGRSGPTEKNRRRKACDQVGSDGNPRRAKRPALGERDAEDKGRSRIGAVRGKESGQATQRGKRRIREADASDVRGKARAQGRLSDDRGYTKSDEKRRKNRGNRSKKAGIGENFENL